MRKQIPGQNNPKGRLNNQSFLEALRDLGKGLGESFLKDVAQGIPQEAFHQIVGGNKNNPIELKPNQTITFIHETKQNEEISPGKQEKNTPRWMFPDLEKKFDEEKEKIRAQIATILEELKRLTTSTNRLTTEVEIACQQPPPPEPGVYHLSFFQKLRQIILLLIKNIESATSWLAVFNHRVKKKTPYYWAQVRKAGTKFMLSQERYMATQTG